MKLTANEAIKEMWSVADKPERLRCFHKIVNELDTSDLDAKTFWRNFWSIWTSSENLFADDEHIRDLVAFGEKLGPATIGLDEDELKALAELPDEVEVYRGACPHNQLGWSWTTDRDKAKWFAGRAFGDTTRYVSVVRVPKTSILAFLTGRGESEVVLNPDDIDGDIDTLEVFEAENTSGQSLFHLIQTGQMLDDPQMDQIRARMTMCRVKQPMIEPTRKSIQVAAEFSIWAGLARAGYYRACLDMLDRLEKGEVLFPETAEEAVGFQM